MSTQLDEPLTPELPDTQTNLAAGLFGLDASVKEATNRLGILGLTRLPQRLLNRCGNVS